MAKLDIVTWMWGTKYHQRDVLRLARQVRKNIRADHTFHLFTDVAVDNLASAGVVVHKIEDPELCGRHCFCRLRLFDPEWQKRHGLTDWIVQMDLDLVITGRLDDVFFPKWNFMILQGVNAVNPNPFNCSLLMLKAGSHPEVWNNFSMEAVQKINYHEFPDDQGWIWSQVPDAHGWKAGSESGVFGFQKPGWPLGTLGYSLPRDALIVAFIGKRKPGMYITLPWVKKFWLNA